MASKKSKPYSVGNSNYSFEFDSDGKLLGIKKEDANGNYKPVDPTSSEFKGLQDSPQALDAYNVNKHKGNTDLYEDEVEQSPDLLKKQGYDNDKKKSDNQGFIDNDLIGQSVAPKPSSADVYKKGSEYSRAKEQGEEVYAYPFDLNTDQDHLKIIKYNYVRPNINQSKPNISGDPTSNTAGDNVKGSKYGGAVLLPMPKVQDVNGAEWGRDTINAFGLAALQTGKTVANLLGATPGLNNEDKQEQEVLRKALKDSGQITDKQLQNFTKALGEAGATTVTTGAAGAAAGLLGTNLSADTILARTGGAVLNPNAEMLFQGPVIRDFSFSFKLIARSQKEGETIRKIIKFFKKGMAPKFRNVVLIKAPDIFILDYRNGAGTLNTVNKFNPGGLALTTLNVDYAPSGYWSAYRDSQPVAVKMDMTFTELRPIYEQDQTDDDSNSGLDSVGY